MLNGTIVSLAGVALRCEDAVATTPRTPTRTQTADTNRMWLQFISEPHSRQWKFRTGLLVFREKPIEIPRVQNRDSRRFDNQPVLVVKNPESWLRCPCRLHCRTVRSQSTISSKLIRARVLGDLGDRPSFSLVCLAGTCI